MMRVVMISMVQGVKLSSTLMPVPSYAMQSLAALASSWPLGGITSMSILAGSSLASPPSNQLQAPERCTISPATQPHLLHTQSLHLGLQPHLSLLSSRMATVPTLPRGRMQCRARPTLMMALFELWMEMPIHNGKDFHVLKPAQVQDLN